jgi:hypothetical protein
LLGHFPLKKVYLRAIGSQRLKTVIFQARLTHVQLPLHPTTEDDEQAHLLTGLIVLAEQCNYAHVVCHALENRLAKFGERKSRDSIDFDRRSILHPQ